MKKIYTVLFLTLISLSSNAQLLDTYNINTSANGVISMPYTFGAYSSFVKYTKIQAPNGQAIHIIAQNLITDAQIVRARNILQFYLTNVPGSLYGADKTAVINKMGTNEAILMLLNGSDGGSTPPPINAQPLYQNEMAVEGHPWYTTNDYNHRDAAYEEILHFMHDMGIGVDGTNTVPGALPAYQSEIRAAQNNADNNNYQIWPMGAQTDPSWYNELNTENSLSQEYLASVVDSYYGFWEAWNEVGNPNSATRGMWGEYIAKTRTEIETEDPMGWAIMPKYFSPMININMDIDPSFTGVFNMSRTTAQPYTYKSQYLQHVSLTGSNASGLKGNDTNNELNGNDANNTIEGAKGNDRIDCKGGTTDKVIFTGNYADYTFTINTDHYIVTDNTLNRDGVDTVYNCEVLKFADQEVAANTLATEDFELVKAFKMFPNPSSNMVTIKLDNLKFSTLKITIYDLVGREVQQSEHKENTISFCTESYSKGIYLVKIKRDTNNSILTKKLIIK